MKEPDVEVFREVSGKTNVYSKYMRVSIVGRSLTWSRPAVAVANCEAIFFAVYSFLNHVNFISYKVVI
jgi:hypothetical protein